MTPEELANALYELNPIQLRELCRILTERGWYEADDEGGAGVREPRNPILPQDQTGSLPEDYWETAQ